MMPFPVSRIRNRTAPDSWIHSPLSAPCTPRFAGRAGREAFALGGLAEYCRIAASLTPRGLGVSDHLRLEPVGLCKKR